LAELLRARVARVVESWESKGATAVDGAGKTALRRFIAALDELVESADALVAGERIGRTPATALLLGDDAKLLSEVQRALEPALTATVAGGVEEALAAARERSPAVVFAAGPQAAEIVRSLREILPGLPAVLAAPSGEVPRLVKQFRGDPALILPEEIGAEGLALAARALSLRDAPSRAHGPAASAHDGQSHVELGAEPRSYAHLTGLLPRSLERTVEFDVGAAVIARPGGEPLVDVHATSECSEATLELVRERALSLFSVVAGMAQADQQEMRLPAPAPFRSSIYVPLATEGRVVGLTYLASLRPDAFSGRDDLMADLAAHASGAYRRLEAAVSRLRLTPRQSQVLALIASGLSDKEVATRLGLAHRTVRTHIDRLLREHGLRSRTEAVAAWLRGQQG